MIQRKQSLFLLGALAAAVALFFFPLAKFYGDLQILELYIYKLTSLVPDQSPEFPAILIFLMAFLNVLILLIALVSIFMYKNRKMQLFLVKAGFLFNLVLIASFFFYYVNKLEEITGVLAAYEVGSWILPLPFIFFILAHRGIMSDEKLVRSADRLR